MLGDLSVLLYLFFNLSCKALVVTSPFLFLIPSLKI